MRKTFMLVAVVYLFTLALAVGANAATCPTPKHKARHQVRTTHKATSHKIVKHRKMVMCTPRRVRHYTPRRGAGPAVRPIVNCPSPIVNVPEQAAPIINVPAQPAPVVNVAAPPATVGITVDTCNIYIVRGNQLMILDKNTLQTKNTVPLGSATQ